jgi:cell wall-associated NlpC family hydrolase
LRFTIPGARALASAAFAATVLLSSSPATPAAAGDLTEANQVIQIAKAQVGDPYRWGATGPSSFDCSGLVIYAFKSAGDLALIGNGNYRSAAAMYGYFRDRGKTSRTTATPGDLVVWGGGSHIGIYLGGGMAISALSSGVRVHAVSAMTIPFTAYLRTGIYQLPKPASAVVAPPDPTPTLAPIATDRPQTQLSRVVVGAERPVTSTSLAR